MLSSDIGIIYMLYYFIIFAFSISVHESAHAYIAYRLGDSTGKDLGRITINPMKHLDIMGTILLFLAKFGWAKPVPINPSKFKNRKMGTVLVSLAGPLSNFILSVIFTFLYLFLSLKFNIVNDFTSTEPLIILLNFAVTGLSLNILLAVFNLLPFPPLDGSKIFTFFLSQKYYFKFLQYQYVTFAIFIILISTGVLENILIPIQGYVFEFIVIVLEPVVNLIV